MYRSVSGRSNNKSPSLTYAWTYLIGCLSCGQLPAWRYRDSEPVQCGQAHILPPETIVLLLSPGSMEEISPASSHPGEPYDEASLENTSKPQWDIIIHAPKWLKLVFFWYISPLRAHKEGSSSAFHWHEESRNSISWNMLETSVLATSCITSFSYWITCFNIPLTIQQRVLEPSDSI